MKRIPYIEVTNCSIQEIKKFAITIALKRNDYYTTKKLSTVVSAYQIKRLLLNDEKLTDYFLKQSIHYLENSENIDEFEKILVYMNALIPNCFKPFIEFKSELYWWVINQINGVFSYEHYAIIRHLKKLNKKQRKELVESIWLLLDNQSEEYHQSSLEIYLVEGDYENAYQHIPYVAIDKEIKAYKPLLKDYDKTMYNKYFSVNHNGFTSKLAVIVEKIMVTCL